MKVAIRVDASCQIGTGHFMRCLTLANTLIQKGAKTRFLSRHLPVHFKKMLEQKGHELNMLKGESEESNDDGLFYSHWLGTSQRQDAVDSLQALGNESWDWLVVDHYALDKRWEIELRKSAKKIMVIDDLADRIHDCDTLLDQNLHADMELRYRQKIPPSCRMLFGPRYAILREEFRKVRETVKVRAGEVRKIMVFFGGIDADNYTGKAIEVLSQLDRKSIKIDVVIGTQHPVRKAIESACKHHQFICHVQTDKMAELMAAADLAIGAGGVATWERCCLGLPTLAICTADNQRAQIDAVAAMGLLVTPKINNDFIDGIKHCIMALIDNEDQRNRISTRAMNEVDGYGVIRIAGALGFQDIRIRKVLEEDSVNLFEWRNHSTIRKVSKNTDAILWEDHQKWFRNVFSDPQRILLIGENDGSPIGVVRFDVRNEEAEISIYLVPGLEGGGMGRELLKKAELWLAESKPAVNKVVAHVRENNFPSKRLFERAGYQENMHTYFKYLN